MKIVIMIPCYNEAGTVAKVIADFRRELPKAEIHVYDNASDDETARESLDAGASVTYEARRGKGNVVRAMFRDIDADIYIMVDGDDTYPAEAVHKLIEPIICKQADMVVGDRLTSKSYEDTHQRMFHRFGNKLVRNIINKLFNVQMCDIMSGYRAFNAFFVKTIPVLSKGFEIETEMTLHALDKAFNIKEIQIDYRERPPGSISKLSTIRDGIKVLKTLFWVFKDFKPLLFFTFLSMLFMTLSLISGIMPVLDYVIYQYVHHVPLAILAVGLMILSMFFFSVGLILDTVAKFQKHEYELYLNRYIETHKS